MSLSTWLRQLANGSPRKTIRTARRPDGSIRSKIALLLEQLEDRFAPAILDWTGADAHVDLPNLAGSTAIGTNGLQGQYLSVTAASSQIIPANLTNTNWLGSPIQQANLITAPTLNKSSPLTGSLNFPSIGTSSFISTDSMTTVVTRVTNTEARWFGFVNVPNNGLPGNPVSWRTRSDDSSDIIIDGTLVVNNDFFQGTTTRGVTIDLAPGLHMIEVDYEQGGGGAAFTAQWDPKGSTAFVDIPDLALNFFQGNTVTGQTANINWSDPNNWVVQGTSNHQAPNNGDTLIFSSNLTNNPNFGGSFTSNNDMSNLTLNGIIFDTTVGNSPGSPGGTTGPDTIASGSFTLTGNAPTINNTDQTLTSGITNLTEGDATFVGTNVIAFGNNLKNTAGNTLTLGSSVTITNGSLPPETAPDLVPLPPTTGTVITPPTPYGGNNVPVAASTPFPAYTNTIALVPSLFIGSKIDLAGHTLTEGPSTGVGEPGGSTPTPDTGFTTINGNIVSSVPTTDGIVKSGTGTLALAPFTNAFISSASESDVVATFNTTAPHGFVVGEQVTIAGNTLNSGVGGFQAGYNGTYYITGVPSPTSFTVNNYNAPGLPSESIVTPVAPAVAQLYAGTVTLAGNYFDGSVKVNSGVLLDAGQQALGHPGRQAVQTVVIGTSADIAATGLSETGTTVTVTTTTPHGFLPGQTVNIFDAPNGGYNGTYTILSVTPTTFTFTGSPGLTPSGSGFAEINSTGGGFTPVFASEIGTTATITTTIPHPFTVGQSVVVSGIAIGGYNGTFTITAVTANTFSYTAAAGLADVSSGSSASESGTTATVTTSIPHPFTVGQSVDVTGFASVPAYNGTFPITAVTANSFSYSLGTLTGLATTANPSPPISGNATVMGSFTATAITTANNPAVSISSVTESGPDVTVTTSAAHGFILGQRVTIAGVSVPQYNGTFTIEAIPSTTTFEYQITSPVLGTQQIGLAAAAAGGTAIGATATVTTAVAHNLTVGEPVSISGIGTPSTAIASAVDAPGPIPGTGTVTITTPTTNIGTAFQAQTNIATATETGTTVTALTPVSTITSAAYASATGIATVTTTANNNLVAGQNVLIAGATPTAFNGTYQVLTASGTTFTYQMAVGQTLANDTAGTATALSGLSVGQNVVVAGASVAGYNGTFPVTAVTNTGFSYTAASGLAASTGGTASGPGVTIINPFALITAITYAPSGIVTVTANNTLTVGQNVLIAGATPTNYNGTFTVLSASATTFTYQIAPNLGLAADSTGGSATAMSNLSTGQNVVIAGVSVGGYNGTFAVTSVNTSSNNAGFTYVATTSGLAPATGGTAELPHNLIVGQQVTIASTATVNVTDSATTTTYNGTYTVLSVPSPNTYTIQTLAGLAPSTGGTSTPVNGANGTFIVQSVPSATTFTYDPTPGALNAIASGSTSQQVTGNNSFTLTFGTGPNTTTRQIPFNASSGTVQAELVNLSSIGLGNVSVSGGAGASAPYSITFQGSLGYAPQALVAVNTANLTGGVAGANAAQVNPVGSGIPVTGVTPFAGVTVAGGSLGVSTGRTLNGIGNGDGVTYAPTAAVTMDAGSSIVTVDNTGPTTHFAINLANPLSVASPKVTILNQMNAGPTFDTLLNMGSMNLTFNTTISTLFIGSPSTTYHALSGIVSTTGASITSIGGQRTTLVGAAGSGAFGNPNLVAAININAGEIAVEADESLGNGQNTVTVANNASLGLRVGFNWVTPQVITIQSGGTGALSNQGVNLGAGGIGAIANIDSTNTLTGVTVNLASGDLTLGSVSGTLVETQPIVLTGSNNVVFIANGGTENITGTITGPATSGIIKSSIGSSGVTISSINNGLTGANFLVGNFLGSTTVNNGLLTITGQGGLGSGTTSSITVVTGGGVGLQGGSASGFGLNLGAVPLFLAGAGPSGGGALESISGNNTASGLITLNSGSTIGSDTNTLTLNGNINTGLGTTASPNRLLSFTGSGATVVNGNISGAPGLALSNGLLEGQTNAAYDATQGKITAALGTDIVLSPIEGETSVCSDTTTAFPTTRHLWTSNDTWVYTGTIFWPNDPLDPGSATLSFAKDIDDGAYLYIDGTTYISNTNYSTPIGSGGIHLNSGPHTFEARFTNGGGGAGADATNNNGWVGWTTAIGFVYRVDSSGTQGVPGTADPKANSTNVADYKIPVDNGTGNLFQVLSPNFLTKSGSGTVTFNGTNTYAATTNIIGGTLVSGTPNALGATAGLSIASGSGLQMPAAGGMTIPATTVITTGISTAVADPTGLTNIVTVNTSGPENFQAGQSVTISGFTGAGTVYNGTWTVLSATSNSFTYLGTTTASPSASGGTVTGTVPLVVTLAGSGASGNGAIESLGSPTATPNVFAATLSLTGPTTIGSDGGTFSLNNPAGVNIAGGILTLTGSGNTTIVGPLSSVGAGLLEGQDNIANDISATRQPPTPSLGIDFQAGTTMAETSVCCDVKTAFPTTQHLWSSTDTFIYTGTIFWPNDPATPGSGTLTFAKDTDDSAGLWIDGTTYISNTSYTTPVSSGPIKLAAGPHTFEARFGNGVGGAGADAQNNNGWSGWTTSIGFIYRFDNNGGTADPKANSTNVADYTVTTGAAVSGLFSAVAPSGVVKSGSGTLLLNTVNTYLGPTTVNGGLLTIKDENTIGGANNATGALNINGGTVEITGSYNSALTPTGAPIFSYGVTGTGTIQVDPGQSVTINSSIAGIGTLQKTGTGLLVLSSSDYYTGTNNVGTIVSAGQVNTGTKLSLGAAPLSLTGGTVSLQAGPQAEAPIAFGTQTAITSEAEGTGANAFTVTATTPAASGFVANQAVTITGSPVSVYNGTYQVIAVTTTAPFTFTYKVTADAQPSAAGGVAVGLSAGFNRDVVWQGNVTLPGFEATPVVGTGTVGVDSTTTIFYNAGSLFSPGGSGLPNSGIIVSAVNPTVGFQLQPYGTTTGVGNVNNIDLVVNGDTSTVTTLGLLSPGQYKTLNVLDLAANNATSSYAMTLIFSDGSSDSVTASSTGGNTVTDWITGTTNLAFKGIGRMSRSSTSTGYTGSGSSPNLQEQDFTLSAADQAKTINAITFKQTSGNTLGILAVSGINFGPGFNVYPNNVTVTANSTLDVSPAVVQTVPEVAGNTSITGATLTVTGNGKAPGLTLGTTTISGATGVSPATGETLTLGQIANAATTSSLNVGGAGITNVPNVPSGVTLSGTGTLGTLTTVGSGGIVDPATATTAGILNTNAGITFAAGSSYNVELGGTTAGSYDSINNTAGTVTLTPTVGSLVGTTLNVSTINSLALAPNETFTIINGGTNPVVGTFAGLPNGAVFNAAGAGFKINYNSGGNNVVLTAEIPGPATHYSIVPSATTTPAGTPVTMTITALDANNLVAISGGSPATISSTTDTIAIFPATVALTNSTATFPVTFRTVGNETVTANATGLTASVSSPAVTVSVAATSRLVVTTSSTQVNPGASFTATVTAEDQFNNPTGSAYTGTVNFSSTTDTSATYVPNNVTLTNGVGTFVITLSPGDTNNQTFVASDAASPGITGSVTVSTVAGSFTPAATSFTVVPVVTGTQTTGTSFQIKVTAVDQHGNVFPGYTGTVSISSSDPSMTPVPNYTFVAADNGVHTFTVTLNSASAAGATFFVRDINATNPAIVGVTAAPIVVQGLAVTAVQPFAGGVTITFSKPFTPADLTEYGLNLTTTQDVMLVQANAGNPQPVNGSVYLDPSNPNQLVFKASTEYLFEANPDAVAALPDDTYTLTLVSGTGTNGFVDALGTHLQGGAIGTAANYTTSFTTTFQDDAHSGANPTPVLAIPDMARGPDSSSTVSVPNTVGAGTTLNTHGIPVTLYDAKASVTDATFTLVYNPNIYTPTAGGTGDAPAGSTFTMGTIATVDANHSSVTFTYHNGTGHTGTVVLGDILGFVPNSAASIYKTKGLLNPTAITITGGATVQATPGLDVDAYLGDVHVTALPVIDLSDAVDAQKVSSGVATGFTSYTLLDPAIIGGFINQNTISVDTADTTALFTKAAHGSQPQLPNIPAGITSVNVSGADPTVSLAGAVQAANGIVSVPVLLDHPDPTGSTGMTEAHLALTYDPSVLSVSPSDITLGSIPGLGTGWQITSEVDAATGQLSINLFNLDRTPITATQAGSLVNIAFHVVPGASVPATAVQLVNQVSVNGQRTLTEVDDGQGPLTLSPGMDRLVVLTGISQVTAAAPTGTTSVVTAAAGNEHVADRQAVAEETASALILGSESGDELAFISNGAVAGETATVHAVPAGVIVSGGLAFQSNQSALAATQPAGQVFQIGNAPMVNAILGGNSPQQLADRLFLALARGSDALAEFNSLSLLQDNLRDVAAQHPDWLAVSSQSSTPVVDSAATPDQEATAGQAVLDRFAVVDQVFSQLADETEDFGDFGDY